MDVVVKMGKEYFIYEGNMHEIDWIDSNKVKPEFKQELEDEQDDIQEDQEKTDIMKLNYDRYERWLRKKAELFPDL